MIITLVSRNRPVVPGNQGHNSPLRAEGLAFELANELRGRTQLPFAIHGGSGVPGAQFRQLVGIGGLLKLNVYAENRRAVADGISAATGFCGKAKPPALRDVVDCIDSRVAAVVREKLGICGWIPAAA